MVGVIASLALFFVQHIAWPEHGGAMQWSRIDGVGLGLTAAATVALLRDKLGVLPVLAVSAMAGLVLRLVLNA